MGAGALCLSAVLLLWVFQRLDPHQFRTAFGGADPAGLLPAFLILGIGFLFAAWRWHLMLQTGGDAVHPGATLRGVLLGHCTHQMLFGAVGGDWAKSALYARRHSLGIASVWAAALLDRTVALAGAVSYGVLTALVAIGAGGYDARLAPHLVFPATCFLLVLALVPAGYFLVRHWEGHRRSSLHTFAVTILRGWRRLGRDRKVLVRSLFSAFCVHACLGISMAFCLAAVVGTPVHWPAILWIFPVIILIAGLPVGAGGAGLRESSALILLGLYGIPPEEAVIAILCHWGLQLIWCLLGLLVWWQGGRNVPTRPSPRSISVVIPAWNEAGHLPETLEAVRRIPEVHEILLADGGSEDGTPEIARAHGCRIHRSRKGRGTQMRHAARHATGDVVWLLHADTVPAEDCGRAMLRVFRDRRVVAGGFWKSFDTWSPWMIGSRFRCLLRLYLVGRVMGDQGLFVRREVLESVGGVPDLPLMEEFELCSSLRRVGRLALADAKVVTSARKFRERGPLRTYWLMAVVTLRWRLGTPARKLAEIYSGRS